MTYWEDNRPRSESPIDEMESEHLLELAESSIRVLSLANLEECRPSIRHDTCYLIAAILETVRWRRRRKFYKQQDKRMAEENEKERVKKDVKTYFDPETDEETRAQLEASISDEDFDAELNRIKYQEKAFSDMVKQTGERLQRFNKLKAKRVETDTA